MSMLSDHTGPVAMEPLASPGEDGKVKRVGSSKRSFLCSTTAKLTWVLAKVKVLTPEIQERVQATEDFFRRFLSQRMLKNHLRDGLVLPLSTPKRYHVTWESSPKQFSTFVGIY